MSAPSPVQHAASMLAAIYVRRIELGVPLKVDYPITAGIADLTLKIEHMQHSPAGEFMQFVWGAGADRKCVYLRPAARPDFGWLAMVDWRTPKRMEDNPGLIVAKITQLHRWVMEGEPPKPAHLDPRTRMHGYYWCSVRHEFGHLGASWTAPEVCLWNAEYQSWFGTAHSDQMPEQQVRILSPRLDPPSLPAQP